MNRLLKSATRALSVRISLKVVLAIATLLLAALLIIFSYSRKVLREEAMEEAIETLEYTLTHIDNVLLSVEQAAGNVYWDMILHLDEPERMLTYSRELVESNPYIAGCAIAFEPYFYKDKGQYFMAYVHRDLSDSLVYSTSPIIQSSTFGNKPYPEQIWYEKPVKEQHPYWITLKGMATDGEAIVTFSLPFSYQGKMAGVMGVDVSLKLLSSIVMAAKPSPNSYAILLDNAGYYIVHPDTSQLFHGSIFAPQNVAELAMQPIGRSMLAGEKDHKSFEVDGQEFQVFYKPFKRSAVPGRIMDDIGWSVAVVYPEEDIFGDYQDLLYVVLIIAIAGLILLFLLCRTYTHRQLLPLRHLTASAQQIANGQYDTPIHDCRQHDEVGRLQAHFQQMQQALSSQIGELKELADSLSKKNEVLADAYEHAKDADRMKMKFLHNMTNQMSTPVSIMSNDVDALCNADLIHSRQEADRLVADILQQGDTVANLLDHLLDSSREQQSSPPTTTNENL